jgi:hypothetical protein
MSQVMEHVHQLAGIIGPRPTTTDAEAQAAEYIEDVLAARGLDVERQEFDCVRTHSWAFVIYHVLTIAAAALSLVSSWPALALAVVVAVVLRLDLDTRFGVSRFLPKGPSQNIIARHVPRVRRGERMKRVIVVAHYDSAVSSLDYSPGLAKNAGLVRRLAMWATVATPVVILLGVLPLAAEWKPWTGYAALAASAYLVVPLIIHLHAQIFGHATDGANDNASGVAAMLGVMEATVPMPDVTSQRTQPLRRSADVAYEAEVVPEDALLEYQDVGDEPAPLPQTIPLDGFGDVGWETGPLDGVAPARASVGPAPDPLLAGEQAGVADAVDADLGSLWEEPSPGAAEPVTGGRPAWRDEEPGEGQERLDLEVAEEAPFEEAAPGRSRDGEEHRGIRDWLGIGRGFDVRKAGKEIGTWDNIESDGDDEFGFKAGTAGGEATADEAARIRRRVTEHVDRALSEKEIWFVATGAKESGGWGMRALLDAYPDDLRDALIINLDNVGAGTVAYVTDEGNGRRYRADRRLISQARRTARENALSVKGQSGRGMMTDATPALARRFRAMSVMAFDINGRLPDRHWHTDVYENVSQTTIETAAAFVTAMIREL